MTGRVDRVDYSRMGKARVVRREARPVSLCGAAALAVRVCVADYSTASRNCTRLGVLRVVEELIRRALLQDHALVEEHHPVRDFAREPHLVRHDHHRHVKVGGERLHHREHLADQLRIERRRRFVEQHHVWLHRERAGDRDALLLAPGQPDRIHVGLVGETDLREQVESHRSRAPGLRHPFTVTGPSMTFLITVICGKRLNCWNTIPACRRSEPDLLALAAGAVPAFEPDPGHLDGARRSGPPGS